MLSLQIKGISAMFWKIGSGSGKSHSLSNLDRGRQTQAGEGHVEAARWADRQRGKAGGGRILDDSTTALHRKAKARLLPPGTRPEVSYLEKLKDSKEKFHILTFGRFPVNSWLLAQSLKSKIHQ